MMSDDDLFQRCEACALKLPNAMLCVSCQSNRGIIFRLQGEVERHKNIAEALASSHAQIRQQLTTEFAKSEEPRPTLLRCPECHKRHIDEGEFATRPHHTHACQFCGCVWRDTIEPSVGVQFLPGFKNG